MRFQLKSDARKTFVVVGAVAAVVALGAGCSRVDIFSKDQESVSPDSKEITFEAYRSKKIMIKIPAGNRNPEISWETLFDQLPKSKLTDRKFGVYAGDTAGLKAAIDASFVKALSSITRDRRTIQTIKKVGELYGVAPITILATIIGEHTFNVDLVDDVQNLIGAAPGWATAWAKKFTTGKLGFGVPLTEVLARPEFETCRDPKKISNEADRWECYNNVWGAKFSGRVDATTGAQWPSGGMRTVFFDPTGVGKTYGLGQLDPQRALMVSDRVSATGGFRMITIEDPQSLYEAIINPNTGLHYVAANIKLAIERYADYANFDITANPGISATLYNLGLEKSKAIERYNENLKLLKAGQPMVLPQENYYGWYVNTRLPDLQKALDGTWQK